MFCLCQIVLIGILIHLLIINLHKYLGLKLVNLKVKIYIFFQLNTLTKTSQQHITGLSVFTTGRLDSLND